MKNRTDRILLAVLLVSAALYALVLLGELLDVFTAEGLLLCLHAVPVFCLQLLLCRNVRQIFVRLIPLLLALLAAAFCLWKMAGAAGWDGLGWAVLFLLCIAPAAGCVLAWIVYGAGRLRQRAGK